MPGLFTHLLSACVAVWVTPATARRKAALNSVQPFSPHGFHVRHHTWHPNHARYVHPHATSHHTGPAWQPRRQSGGSRRMQLPVSATPVGLAGANIGQINHDCNENNPCNLQGVRIHGGIIEPLSQPVPTQGNVPQTPGTGHLPEIVRPTAISAPVTDCKGQPDGTECTKCPNGGACYRAVMTCKTGVCRVGAPNAFAGDKIGNGNMGPLIRAMTDAEKLALDQQLAGTKRDCFPFCH